MMAIVYTKLFVPISISFSVVIATTFSQKSIIIKLLRDF